MSPHRKAPRRASRMAKALFVAVVLISITNPILQSWKRKHFHIFLSVPCSWSLYIIYFIPVIYPNSLSKCLLVCTCQTRYRTIKPQFSRSMTELSLCFCFESSENKQIPRGLLTYSSQVSTWRKQLSSSHEFSLLYSLKCRRKGGS